VENSIRDFLYFASFLKDEITAYTLLSELSRITKIPVEVLSGRMRRREEVPERDEDLKLSFTERVFLKGLLELKRNVNLDTLNLSQRARAYAESILKKEYYDIPEEILNLRSLNLEEEFSSALESLRIDIPEEELMVAGKSLQEAVREKIRKHKGGIRGSSLRRWRNAP